MSLYNTILCPGHLVFLAWEEGTFTDPNWCLKLSHQAIFGFSGRNVHSYMWFPLTDGNTWAYLPMDFKQLLDTLYVSTILLCIWTKYFNHILHLRAINYTFHYTVAYGTFLVKLVFLRDGLYFFSTSYTLYVLCYSNMYILYLKLKWQFEYSY